MEAINRAILEAAKEQFFSLGVPAASMEAIRLAAGVSKGALYARFPTKEDLVAALIEKQIDDWNAMEPVKEEVGNSLKDVLRFQARRLMRYTQDRDVRGFGAILTGPARPPRELAHRMYDVGYRRGVQGLAHVIETAAAAEGFRPRRPERVAEFLMCMIMGWAHSHEIVGDATPAVAQDAADQAVEFLLAARDVW